MDSNQLQLSAFGISDLDGMDNASMQSSYNESPPEQSPDAEEFFGQWDSGSEDRYQSCTAITLQYSDNNLGIIQGAPRHFSVAFSKNLKIGSLALPIQNFTLIRLYFLDLGLLEAVGSI